jgi:hypothetical protein
MFSDNKITCIIKIINYLTLYPNVLYLFNVKILRPILPVSINLIFFIQIIFSYSSYNTYPMTCEANIMKIYNRNVNFDMKYRISLYLND